MTMVLQRVGHRAVRAVRDALYPMTCMMCDARVEAEGALCPACWSDTPFLSGASCDLCGIGLPGQNEGANHCDTCLTAPPPWDEARAALAYSGTARRLVLALKHGDRTELARGAGGWIHRRARDVLTPETLILPVPIHRWRLLKRRYNQSALLAEEIARRADATTDPMILVRHRETLSQDHRSVADRFANIDGSISVAAGAEPMVADRHIAVVDDVMTSGATLTACTAALRQAGAARITALILARVAKAP